MDGEGDQPRKVPELCLQTREDVMSNRNSCLLYVAQEGKIRIMSGVVRKEFGLNQYFSSVIYKPLGVWGFCFVYYKTFCQVW